MKAARPASRKLRSKEPVGDRERTFVDGVRVCLQSNPGGGWYWALKGELIPTRPFRTERDAAGRHAHRGRR
jgi:hypothetical protein